MIEKMIKMANNELKEVLEKKFKLSTYLNKKEATLFYDSIEDYITRKKISINSLKNRIDETIEFLQFLDLKPVELLTTVRNYPSLIHANKRDLLDKYLLLGVLKDSKTHEEMRRNILINHPKYLIIGIKTLYARYKFLLEQDSKFMTRYYLLKMTNNEFNKTFRITNETLVATYPYTDKVIYELLELKENAIYKEKIANLKEGK